MVIRSVQARKCRHVFYVILQNFIAVDLTFVRCYNKHHMNIYLYIYTAYVVSILSKHWYYIALIFSFESWFSVFYTFYIFCRLVHWNKKEIDFIIYVRGLSSVYWDYCIWKMDEIRPSSTIPKDDFSI